MNIIAHRARFEGSIFADNSLEALEFCLSKGFGCEIDLHYKNGAYFLGHDAASDKVELKLIDLPGVFLHLKNPHLPELKFADAFFINKDDCAYTKNNNLWVNVGIDYASDKTIMCSPELCGLEFNGNLIKKWINVFGICTDYPVETLKILNNNYSHEIIK